MPTKTKNKIRGKNLVSKNSFKNKYLLILPLLVFAALGVKLLFFASASPNNCSYDVCDVNQGASPGESINAVLGTGTQVSSRVAENGWQDYGVPFRALKTPRDGAKAVHQFYREDITSTEYAVEGTSYFNTLQASNNDTSKPSSQRHINQGVSFYAWATSGTKDTIPIYRVCRGGWYQMSIWTPSKQLHDWWVGSGQDWFSCGINFYAYPSNYVYTPASAPARPAKNTGCATANLTLGDSGDCVVKLRQNLITNFGVSVDATSKSFDAKLNDMVTYLIAAFLKNEKKVNVPTYSNVVTEAHWNALSVNYTSPNNPTPAPKPAPVPVPVPTPTNPNPSNPATTPRPSDNTKVTCVGDGSRGARVQLVYMRGQGTKDRYEEAKKLFQISAVRIDSNVMASAKKTGGTRHVRWVHNTNCEPTVLNITIPDAKNTGARDAILHFLGNKAAGGLGFYNNDRKYLIYHDTSVMYCGLGGIVFPSNSPYKSGDTPDPATNRYNQHSGFGMFSPNCWGPVRAVGDTSNSDVQLHELWHAFGAVNESAQRSSYAGHCNDDQDVMCYDDRADPSNQPKTLQSNVCADPKDNFLLDCGNNDYFNTNPKKGSYLDTHWNTANSRFLMQ